MHEIPCSHIDFISLKPQFCEDLKPYNPPSSITSPCEHSVTSVSILTFKSPRVFQSWIFVIKLGWAKPDHWMIRQITLVTDAGRCACWVPFGPRGHERLHRSPDHQGIVLQHGCFRGSCQIDSRFTYCIPVLSQNCTHVKKGSWNLTPNQTSRKSR
jgi:hypothetical protein